LSPRDRWLTLLATDTRVPIEPSFCQKQRLRRWAPAVDVAGKSIHGASGNKNSEK
jgi:hypothetical protein